MSAERLAELRVAAARPGRGGGDGRPRAHRGGGAGAAPGRRARSRDRLHRAPPRPAPPRRRDLVPGRPPRLRRTRSCFTTALREAHEEIGLDPGDVELVGALPPIGTFVTNYKVHPFVGRHPRRRPSSSRTRTRLRRCFASACPSCGEAFAMRRLVRMGRADPHAHLPDRRPPDLGRHRPDPGRAARPDRLAATLTVPGCEAPDEA